MNKPMKRTSPSYTTKKATPGRPHPNCAPKRKK